jgi:hypothetical protein
MSRDHSGSRRVRSVMTKATVKDLGEFCFYWGTVIPTLKRYLQTPPLQNFEFSTGPRTLGLYVKMSGSSDTKWGSCSKASRVSCVDTQVFRQTHESKQKCAEQWCGSTASPCNWNWLCMGSFDVKVLCLHSKSNIFPLIFIYVCASLIIFKCLWVDVHMPPFWFFKSHWLPFL